MCFPSEAKAEGSCADVWEQDKTITRASPSPSTCSSCKEAGGEVGCTRGWDATPGGPWLPSGTHLSVPRVHAAGCLERPRALAEVLKRGPAAGAPFRLQAVVGAVVAVLGAIVGAVGASMPQEEVAWTPKWHHCSDEPGHVIEKSVSKVLGRWRCCHCSIFLTSWDRLCMQQVMR